MDSLQQQNGCDQYCPILGASPKRFSWIIYKFWDWIQVKQTWHPSGSILQGCTRPVYLYLCPVGSPKTIDAHSICLWYSVCPIMSMPIRPVGIPIMSCGLSHYALWALPIPLFHIVSHTPVIFSPPYEHTSMGTHMPCGHSRHARGIPSMPCGLFLYALWAFTLRPVGIHIIPRGHCQVGVPTPISYCVPYACGLQYDQHTPMDIHMPSGHSHYALWVFQSCPVGIPNSHRHPGVFSDMVFSQTLKSAWIWIRSWKLLDFPICLENYHFFLENCLKMTLVGLKN